MNQAVLVKQPDIYGNVLRNMLGTEANLNNLGLFPWRMIFPFFGKPRGEVYRLLTLDALFISKDEYKNSRTLTITL